MYSTIFTVYICIICSVGMSWAHHGYTMRIILTDTSENGNLYSNMIQLTNKLGKQGLFAGSN